MKFKCYSDWNQLPASASALLEQSGKSSIFFSRQWLEALTTTTLAEDQSLVLACVLSDSRVIAMLPLLKSPGNTWHALKHRYTPVYSLQLADDDQSRVLACLGQGLSQLPLYALLLEPIDDDDKHLEALQQVMETLGFSCDRTFRLYNWIYRVQEQSFADYMAARPARLRNTIARKGRKLQREHGYNIRLYIGDEVPQAMSEYYNVYNASWKANEQYPELMRELVAGFSSAGWSRLAVLYINERPAAAQLWFVHHDKASIFRLAYDEAWKNYSPGSILTAYLMEYVIDVDGVKEIDFLTGNDAYKQDWMSERRERVALSCIKKSKPAGRYKQFIESLKRILKRP